MDRREFYVDPQDFEIQLWALQEHLRQHPDDADARLVLAYNLYFTRRPDAARAELQKILEAHPDNATAQYFLKHTQN